MGITVTKETTDNQWADGEQGEYPGEGTPISLAMAWEDEVEEEDVFTKDNFEEALGKVSL